MATAIIEECGRSFRQRIVNKDDKTAYEGMLTRLIKVTFPGYRPNKDYQFISILKKSSKLNKIPVSDLMQILQTGLTAFGREFMDLGLKIPEEVLGTILRIDKMLSKPGGKAMMIGKSGIGKKSLTKLLCYLANIQFETVFIGKHYTMRDFKKNLKLIIEAAGINNNRVCLYIEDHTIVEDEFLEVINSLLSSNEIVGLFKVEEVEG